jgi:hypothetical protein
MRFTVHCHLTLDGVMQSNGKPELELNDGFEQGGWQVSYFDDDAARPRCPPATASIVYLLEGGNRPPIRERD